jgi:hypothetical protein
VLVFCIAPKHQSQLRAVVQSLLQAARVPASMLENASNCPEDGQAHLVGMELSLQFLKWNFPIAEFPLTKKPWRV